MFLAAVSSGLAHSTSIWNWSGIVSNSPVSGTVLFTAISNGAGGYNLEIDITNTATVKPTSTDNILTGVYFDVLVGGVAPGALGMKSAIATGGLLDTAHATTPFGINSNVCAPSGVNSALNPSCASTVAGGLAARLQKQRDWRQRERDSEVRRRHQRTRGRLQ